MFPKQTYIARREKLRSLVGSGVIVLFGNDEAGCNYADNTYHFRQDSTFLYYFGLPYAGLAAVIDIDNGTETIFGDELSIDYIVWMGTQPSLKEKAERVGVANVVPAANLDATLDAARKADRKIHYLPPYRPEHEIKLMRHVGVMPGLDQASTELIRAVVEMRNHKTPEEIEEIERACNVTADMHIAAMKAVRPGMYEYELAAVIENTAKRQNCELSFPIICTINGQTLHNHYHGNLIKPGDLVLIDAGAETQMGYAGDMSSTFPADPTFTPRQKTIYDVQVAAHLAAVEMLRPGVPFVDVYEKSVEVICDAMKGLGIVRGNPHDAMKAGAGAMFMPCGLGHMMGLDVHDMENLGEVWVGWNGIPKSTQFGRKSLRLGRPLEEGFVLTIEPGVYFIPELIDYWRSENRFADFINYDELDKWRDFGGVRNEEDYLITPDGARRLGKKIPLTTEEVDNIRK